MLQRLPIALAQLKARNISENLLNEIRQNKTMFSLCINQNKSQKSIQQHNQIYSITYVRV